MTIQKRNIRKRKKVHEYNSLLVTKINNKTTDITKIHNILKLAYHFTHASTTICNKFFFFSITPLIMR